MRVLIYYHNTDAALTIANTIKGQLNIFLYIKDYSPSDAYLNNTANLVKDSSEVRTEHLLVTDFSFTEPKSYADEAELKRYVEDSLRNAGYVVESVKDSSAIDGLKQKGVWIKGKHSHKEVRVFETMQANKPVPNNEDLIIFCGHIRSNIGKSETFKWDLQNAYKFHRGLTLTVKNILLERQEQIVPKYVNLTENEFGEISADVRLAVMPKSTLAFIYKILTDFVFIVPEDDERFNALLKTIKNGLGYV